MVTRLAPTAENFRAEMARNQLSRQDLRKITGMHVNALSNYISEHRPMPGWAAQNIAYAINTLTNRNIFDINMDLGVVPPRPKNAAVRLPVPPKPKLRNWRRRWAAKRAAKSS